MPQQQRQQRPSIPIWALPAVTKNARMYPERPEHDLEAEMKLRAMLTEQITKLNELDAKIKEGAMGSYTEVYKARAKALTDAMSSMAQMAGANAQMKKALVDYMSNQQKEEWAQQGKILGGLPDPDLTKVYDPILSQGSADLRSRLRNEGGLGANTAQLADNLKNAGVWTTDANGKKVYTQAYYDYYAAVAPAVHGPSPTSLSTKVQDQMRLTSGTVAGAVPTVQWTQEQVQGMVAEAVNQTDFSPEIKAQLAYDMTNTFQVETNAAMDRQYPEASRTYREEQAKLRQERADERAKLEKKLGAGFDAKTKAAFGKLMDDLDATLNNVDPLYAMDVAEKKLADRGIAKPEFGTPEWAAYAAQLKEVMGTVAGADTFMQRMINAPGDKNIASEIADLKRQRDMIGVDPEDPFAKETAAFRSRLGEDNFQAWMTLTGTTTAEDAARAAGNDPGKVAAFMKYAADPELGNALRANPKEFRAQVNSDARIAAKASRLASREALDAYNNPKPPPTEAPTEGEKREEIPEPDTTNLPEAEGEGKPPAAPPPPKKPEPEIDLGDDEPPAQAPPPAPDAVQTDTAQKAAVTTTAQEALGNQLAQQAQRRTQYGPLVGSPVSGYLGNMARQGGAAAAQPPRRPMME